MANAMGVKTRKNTMPSIIGVVIRLMSKPNRIHNLYTGFSDCGAIAPQAASMMPNTHGQIGKVKPKRKGIRSANSTMTIAAVVNANLRKPAESSSGITLFMFRYISRVQIHHASSHPFPALADDPYTALHFQV